jgi:hypothetical protein
VHGEQDPLIPSRCSSETNEALRNAGAETNPEFHILKNREHDITLETDDGLTLPFLAGRKRRAFPSSLAFRVANPDYGRNYWIEADPKQKASGSVDAKIEPDNTLKITAHDAERVTLYLRPDLFPKPGPIRIVLNKKDVFQGEIGNDCELLEKTAATAGDAQMGATDRKEFDLRK